MLAVFRFSGTPCRDQVESRLRRLQRYLHGEKKGAQQATALLFYHEGGDDGAKEGDAFAKVVEVDALVGAVRV